jgi:hypothetical protein
MEQNGIAHARKNPAERQGFNHGHHKIAKARSGKSAQRFSGKIVLEQQAKARRRFVLIASAFSRPSGRQTRRPSSTSRSLP